MSAVRGSPEEAMDGHYFLDFQKENFALARGCD